MEKQEARIKCTNCGTTFKVKIPATDKPIGFKCKKCGKQLKIKPPAPKKAEAPPPPPPPSADPGMGEDSFGDSAFEPTSFDSTSSESGGAADSPFELDNFGDFGSEPDAPPPPPPPAQPAKAKPEKEEDDGYLTTQLPDTFDYQDDDGPPPIVQTADDVDRRLSVGSHVPTPLAAPPPSAAPTPTPGAAGADRMTITSAHDEMVESISDAETPGSALDSAPVARSEGEARWLVLLGEQVTGPFSDEEIKTMIREGDLTADTALRMGERPWIKASLVPNFKALFKKGSRPLPKRPIPQLRIDGEDEEDGVRTPPFYEDLKALAPYPLGAGDWRPLAIFAGIAALLSVILCLNFLIGLPINIIGWILLYGYLDNVAAKSMEEPASPPPSWGFDQLADMAQNGAKVFVILLVLSLLPVTLFLLMTIALILNKMVVLGFVFLFLTIVVFAISLTVIPASLVILSATRSVGSSLNPGKIIKLAKQGGKPYQMLVMVSLGAGMACMVVTILGVFLVDIPLAGFVVAGLLMAVGLSYAHFLWFHVLGRFSGENPKLTNEIQMAVSS